MTIIIIQILASAALGALIGFGTNWLAIKSLFRPLRPRWYSLGWQGVIPRNKEKLASNISKVVGTDLLARDDLLEQLQNATLQKSLHRFIAVQIDRLLSASLASGFAQLPPSPCGNARCVTRPFAARNPRNTESYSPLAEGS